MDKQCNLKIKHFSALHLFLVPMLICGLFGVNFNLFTLRDIKDGEELTLKYTFYKVDETQLKTAEWGSPTVDME